MAEITMTLEEEKGAPCMNGHKQNKPARRKRVQQAAAVEADEEVDQKQPPAAPKKRRRGAKAAAAQSMPAAAEGQAAAEHTEEGEAAKNAKGGKPRAKKAKEAEQAAEEKLEWVSLPSACPKGKLVGAHVSMASGIERAVINAASIGALGPAALQPVVSVAWPEVA